MKTTKRRYWLLPYICSLLFFFSLVSCGGLLEDMEQEFLKREMTQEQAETFAHEGLRLRFAKKDANGGLATTKSSDGKEVYVVNYASITTEAKLEKLLSSISALEKILDPRSQEPISGYINDVGIRDKLLDQLATFRIIAARLSQINAYKAYLREYGFSEKELESRKDLGNDLLVQCPWFDLFAITRFEPESVTKAKKGEVPYQIVNSADLNTTYQVVRDNPDYPEKDKIKKTVTVLEKAILRFLSVDIDKDEKPDFIEVYRLGADGQPEKYPIISLHKTMTSATPTLLSYDIDSPGHPSFGVPDGFVSTFGDIKNGIELISGQKEIFERVLSGREAEKKLAFLQGKAKMQTWIVRPGDVRIDEEIAIDEAGWPLPSTPYNFGKNFEVFAKRAAPEKMPDKAAPADTDFTVEWIAFRYHDIASKYLDIQGRPVEFYRLNPEFAGKKFSSFTISKDGTTIEFSGSDGKFDKRSVKAMIAEHPFRIDYDSGDYRLSLVDGDDNQKYEKKTSTKKTTDIGLNEKSVITGAKEASDAY